MYDPESWLDCLMTRQDSIPTYNRYCFLFFLDYSKLSIGTALPLKINNGPSQSLREGNTVVDLFILVLSSSLSNSRVPSLNHLQCQKREIRIGERGRGSGGERPGLSPQGGRLDNADHNPIAPAPQP